MWDSTHIKESSQPSLRKEDFATQEEWIAHLRKEFNSPEWEQEFADQRSYVEFQIKNINENDLYLLGKGELYNNYQNYKNESYNRLKPATAKRITEFRLSAIKNLEKYEYVKKFLARFFY